ncbi:MAG: hypothetical protein CVU41_17500 [Chloroflexi bacterium HGW-Chloroflexi-3]|nr:MAG: hypothetical protein CVU41_17500 [Chloroflexi bacterium HGW-Chloroflexi-3]
MTNPKYQIVDYKESWPQEFAQIARQLREGLGDQLYPLLFRDCLRSHPKTAEAYAHLKRMLAEHLAEPSMYPDVKDPAVDLIYLAAEDWAEQTNWKPGRSDF